ncbi:MAG: hypothetical protein HQL23_02895 [Candidatus Omnitrophica bacterium]|nr:hypothetical protein [Candidatus Omnitrophota bacterium]
MSKVKMGLAFLAALLFFAVGGVGWLTLEKGKLEEKNALLSRKLEKAENTATVAQREAGEIRKQKDDQEQQFNEAQSDYDKKLNALEADKRDALAKAETITKDKERVQSQIDNLRKERDRLVKELKEAKDNPMVVYKEKIQEAQTAAASSAAGATPAPAAALTGGMNVNNEEYWATVLRDKAALEVELQNLKGQLSQNQIDIVELRRLGDEYKVKIDQFANAKKDVERELIYKTETINNLALELARTKNERKFVIDNFDKVNKENGELRNQLQALVGTKGALEKTIVKLSKDKSDVEHKLGQTDALVQSKIDEIWAIKESLDTAFQSSKAAQNATAKPVELPPIVVTGNSQAPSFNPGVTKPGFNGKVVSINKENNFVIVDIGESAGIKTGDSLSVYRDQQYIARLEVIQVRKDISAADIKDQWTPIQAGDAIR